MNVIVIDRWIDFRWAIWSFVTIAHSHHFVQVISEEHHLKTNFEQTKEKRQNCSPQRMRERRREPKRCSKPTHGENRVEPCRGISHQLSLSFSTNKPMQSDLNQGNMVRRTLDDSLPHRAETHLSPGTSRVPRRARKRSNAELAPELVGLDPVHRRIRWWNLHSVRVIFLLGALHRHLPSATGIFSYGTSVLTDEKTIVLLSNSAEMNEKV